MSVLEKFQKSFPNFKMFIDKFSKRKISESQLNSFAKKVPKDLGNKSFNETASKDSIRDLDRIKKVLNNSTDTSKEFIEAVAKMIVVSSDNRSIRNKITTKIVRIINTETKKQNVTENLQESFIAWVGYLILFKILLFITGVIVIGIASTLSEATQPNQDNTKNKMLTIFLIYANYVNKKK